MSQLLLCSIVMQNLRIFYGGPVMFVVTCFSVLLVSQWFQHFLMWLLVFSNSIILIVLILLFPIPSLNRAIKLSLNLVTVSLLKIVRQCIPENNSITTFDPATGGILSGDNNESDNPYFFFMNPSLSFKTRVFFSGEKLASYSYVLISLIFVYY